MPRIEGCRICANPDLKTVLDYGMMPLVNNLDEEAKYPLQLVVCNSCGLVQITETVDPSVLFGNYAYFSSQSQTMLNHSKGLVEELIATRGLDEHSLVIEPASNDGYLLQYYVERGIPVLGVEPAQNLAQFACERGVPTLWAFFGAVQAGALREMGIKADVIHAHNVLAHVADLHGFVEGIRLILKPDGIAIIEVPYLGSLVENCEFDTVYHEHLCYFALKPLQILFARHKMGIREILPQAIHGGSVRLSVAHGTGQSFYEKEIDLDGFAVRAKAAQANLVSRLSELKSRGKTIAAYGAAAKGCVFLNTCGIDEKTIDFVVDSTPAKQGKCIPGTGIRICPPEKLLEEMPDYCLILAWNFADEIIEKETGYKGRWIMPNPRWICA